MKKLMPRAWGWSVGRTAKMVGEAEEMQGAIFFGLHLPLPASLSGKPEAPLMELFSSTPFGRTLVEDGDGALPKKAYICRHKHIA